MAFAKPGYLGAVPYAAHVLAAPAAVGVATSVSNQYHAQDTLGQYSYGYSGGPSAKTETRTADGITRGGYSYIDGHGLVQSASYVSDPVNGFRVAATNLPVGPSAPAAPVAPLALAAPIAPVAYAHGIPAVAAGVPLDTPEVAAAKAVHFAAHADAVARLGRKKRSIGVHEAVGYGAVGYGAVGYAAAPAAVSYAAPAVSYAAAPAVVSAPAAVSYAAPAVSYAAPAVVAAPVVEPVKSFGYSTASVHADPVVVAAPAPAVAVAHAAPAVVAAPAYVEPVKSFGYSTASVHADPVVVAAPAPAVAVAHAAPAVVAAPAVRSFGYSTGAVHADSVVVGAAAPAVVAAHAAPVAVAHAAPVAYAHAVAPAVSTSSQYQAQDTLGSYSYGYADSNSQKHESRHASGITQGGYSYVDGHGIVQSANYVADALGFRVAATNLPVGPAAH